jgi:NAD(P)-dependent dehydrogenase (short-subunit alcohol dehydrogenase family)
VTAAPRPFDDACHVLAAGRLRDRTALVTGAGSGIGRAITLRLLDLGAHVIGVGRRVAGLEQTAQLAGTDRFRFESLDIRDRAAASAFVAGIGDLDLLVNNAGGQFVAPADKISRRGFDAVADLNLTALASLVQAARPGLLARRGRVVNLSLSAPDRGIAGLAHSAAARAGVAALTASLAREWRTDGIRLFCLAPGTVLTAGVGEELPPEALAHVVATTPLGRDTTLAEVAEWVAALGSGVADAVSGSLIELDGGSGLVSAASLTGRETSR